MLRKVAALLAALFLCPSPAMAWWDYGHETIATIAIQQVTPRTRTAIRSLLAKGALLETPDCPVATIEQASLWADCIKKLGPRFSYATPWHYQNVDICKPFDLKAACADGNCVSAQIERNLKLLIDRAVPPRERLMALAFLIHFTGDLHMPLHAGDKGDLGGNRARAGYGIFVTERMNLHSIWDGYLAERAISTPPSLVRIYRAEDRAAMSAGSVEDWSRESWQMSRDTVYASAFGGDPCATAPPARAVLENATIDRLIPPLRLQIERGGIRLARLLDEALG